MPIACDVANFDKAVATSLRIWIHDELRMTPQALVCRFLSPHRNLLCGRQVHSGKIFLQNDCAQQTSRRTSRHMCKRFRHQSPIIRYECTHFSVLIFTFASERKLTQLHNWHLLIDDSLSTTRLGEYELLHFVVKMRSTLLLKLRKIPETRHYQSDRQIPIHESSIFSFHANLLLPTFSSVPKRRVSCPPINERHPILKVYNQKHPKQQQQHWRQ